MATYVFNPKSGKVCKAQKKGISAKGDKQYWLDTETKTRFTTEPGAEQKVDQNTGNLLEKQQDITEDTKDIKGSTNKKIDTNTSIKTNIKVNSNLVKTIPGEVTIDEAFALVSTYFREVTKTNVKTIKDNDGNLTITFEVRTGTKG